MKAIVFDGAGGNEVISLQTRADPRPGSSDVVVAVRYAGLNPADVMQRKGLYPAPPGVPADVPGLEVAGLVTQAGADASWSVGDRVFGLIGGGGLADSVVVPANCLMRVPESLDDEAAAAVPETFMTAYDAVSTQARLRAGEVLLVHGSGGGVGSAAVQMGVLAGARVLAVVRSDAAAARVSELGAEPLQDEGFAEQVAELTGGAGADVIIELVGAPHFPANVDLLAQFGRIVVVGIGAGQQAEVPLLTLMRKRASIRGTVLRSRSIDEKAAVVSGFARDLGPALAAGALRPFVDGVFPAARCADAFDRLATRGRVGKVLLDFGATAGGAE